MSSRLRLCGVRISSTAALGLAFSFAAGSADADMSKRQCIEANTKSQELRRQEKLAEAREQLERCADPACPAMVREDCTRRMDELHKVQPTLVFDVKDAKGGDLIDVRVSIDGRPLVDRLDGTPLKVDPGAHSFTFELSGEPAIVDTLLVREGETGRHERVVFEGVGKAPPPVAVPPASLQAPAPSTASSGDSSSPHRLGTQKTVGLVVGGVGVAGLAAGGVLGLLGTSAWSSAKQACGGNVGACTDVASGASYRNTASTEATAATVGFIAGGALVAAGAVLFLAGRKESHPVASLLVGPSVGLGAAGVVLSGEFQ